MSQLRSCRRPQRRLLQVPECGESFGLFLTSRVEETSRELLPAGRCKPRLQFAAPWRAEEYLAAATHFLPDSGPQLNRFHSLIPARLARAAKGIPLPQKGTRGAKTHTSS